jgi:hypothetical protein
MPPEGVVFDAPHFMTYPAYQFEGLRPEEREIVAERRYRVRVYEVTSPRALDRAGFDSGVSQLAR